MIQLQKSPGMRILSLILSLAVVCTTFPITAFAAGAPEDTTGTIRAFDTLDSGFSPAIGKDAPDGVYFIKVEPNTPAAELPLPTTLSATVERTSYEGDSGQWVESIESGTEEIPVTWKGERAYDPTTAGQFLYTPTLPEGYVLADGVRLPQIYIVVGSKLARSGTTHTAGTDAELQAALNNAANGDTIQVTANIDLGGAGVTLSGDKSVTLDLNGKTITYNGNAAAVQLKDTASLTVTDGSTEKTGMLSAINQSYVTIGNDGTGTVTVQGGTVEISGLNSIGYAIYNGSTGHIVVSGGTVKCKKNLGGSTIENLHNGTVTVSGGTVEASETSAIDNARTGKITISGEATVRSAVSNRYGTIYLNAVPDAPSVILEIKGGTVEHTAGGYSVYFYPNSVTTANLSSYYSYTAGTVGKVFPEVAAQITKGDGTTTYYTTLEGAFGAAGDGDIIKVLSDTTFAALSLAGNKSITLDLDGKTITYSGEAAAIRLTDTASLTVTDSSDDKSGVLSAYHANGSTAINNGGTGTVTIEGGTVEAGGGGTTITIYNASTGSVTVSGGTVEVSGEGGIAIRNASAGPVTIEGGTVKATGAQGMAINNSGTGKITISDEAVVTSAHTGDYGTIFLYAVPTSGDLTVLEITGGSVTNTASPEGYAVYFKPETGVTTANLGSYYKHTGGTVGRVYPEAAAQITKGDGTTAYYATLVGAFGAAVDGDTIKVLADIDLAAGVNYSSKSLTLDLNGKIITRDAGNVIYLESGASLTVTDGSSEKTGKLSTSGEDGSAIHNNSTGTVTVEGGTVEATGGWGCAIRNYGTGSVTLSGGTVQATDATGIAVYNYSTGTITISGEATVTGTGIGGCSTILLNEVPTPPAIILDIQGGSVTNTASPEGYAVYFDTEAVTPDNLDDYYRPASGTVGRVYPEPVAQITKGDGTTASYATLEKAFNAAGDGDTIQVLSDIELDTTRVELSGNKLVTLDLNGKIITRDAGGVIYLQNGASLTVTDGSTGKTGKLSATGEDCSAIHNKSTGSVTIEGGTVEATGASGFAISNISTGTVTVRGGTVEASGDAGATISNRMAGSVTISGGAVKATSADGIAIYNAGTGKITVSGEGTVTSAITGEYGTIYLRAVPATGDLTVLEITGGSVTNTASPEGYAVYFAPETKVTADNLGSYYKHTGGTVGRVCPEIFVAQITKGDGTTTSYTTLEKAFNAAGDGDTIQVIADIDLAAAGVIYSDKSITLDLNGKTITYGGDRYAIELSGTASLTVTDGSTEKTGKLSATSEESWAIYNEGTGTVTIEGGTVEVTGASGIAISNISTGTVTVRGGTVEASGDAGATISNNMAGSVTVSGGAVKATAADGIAIFNSGTGKITISGEASVESSATGALGTIWLAGVPTSGDLTALEITGGSVTNTASPEGYSVYFGPATGVTADNLNDYYRHTGGTVGRVYPEPSTPKPTPKPDGDGGSGWNDTIPTITPPAGIVIDHPVSSTIMGIINDTVKKAMESGEKEAEATLNYQNATALTPEGLKAINEAAAAAAEGSGIKLTLKMQLDRVVNGSVRSRITVDPAKLAAVLTGKIGLGLWLDQAQDARVAAVLGLFRQYYKNDFLVLSFEQEIPLGVDVEIAVKLDLSTFDVKPIVLYSYDGTKNSYTRIANPNYWLDGNGYSHFTVPFGGSVVISEGILAPR